MFLDSFASSAIEFEEVLGLKRPLNGPAESTIGARCFGSRPVGDFSKGPRKNFGLNSSSENKFVDVGELGDVGDVGDIGDIGHVGDVGDIGNIGEAGCLPLGLDTS